MDLQHSISQFFGALEGLDYAPRNPTIDTQAMLRAWTGLCGHLSPEEFTAAAGLWLRQDRFKQWPAPGAVICLAEQQRQALVLSAEEARGLLLHRAAGREHNKIPCLTASDVGALNGDGFLLHTDAQVAAGMMAGIQAMGGWRAFGHSDPSDPSARKAFRDAYNAGSKRRQAAAQLSTTGAAQRLRLEGA